MLSPDELEIEESTRHKRVTNTLIFIGHFAWSPRLKEKRSNRDCKENIDIDRGYYGQETIYS